MAMLPQMQAREGGCWHCLSPSTQSAPSCRMAMWVSQKTHGEAGIKHIPHVAAPLCSQEAVAAGPWPQGLHRPGLSHAICCAVALGLELGDLGGEGAASEAVILKHSTVRGDENLVGDVLQAERARHVGLVEVQALGDPVLRGEALGALGASAVHEHAQHVFIRLGDCFHLSVRISRARNAQIKNQDIGMQET